MEKATLASCASLSPPRILRPSTSTSAASHNSSSSNNNGNSNNSDALLQDKLGEFAKVLAGIPPNEKRAYLKAQEVCPHLIETESKPLLFLRRHNFQVWNAVQAFLGYWEARRQVFGSTRAYKPLDLTGQGALTTDDVAALQGSFTILLPEHESGAPVILCCPDQVPTTVRQDVVARTFFYIRNVAALNPLAQALGYYGLIRYSPTWKTMAASSGMRLGMAAMEHIPIAVRHVIVLVNPHEIDDVREHLTTMAERVPAFRNIHILSDDGDNDHGDLIPKLEAQGFTRENLPACMGGQLDKEQATAWLKKFKKGLDCKDYYVSGKDSVAARIASHSALKGGTKAEWGMRVLEETLAFMADSEEKSAYLEALQVAPELVKAESDPHKFLEAVDYDGWAAAQKLCKYWFYRKKWFGSKAFRPMTMNGKGALSKEEFNFLQRGLFQVLPRDNHGRPCVVFHSSGTAKGIAVLRVIFYFVQKVCEDDACREHGTSSFVHFTGEWGHIDGAKWVSVLDFTGNGTPIKSTKTIILGRPGATSMARGQALKQIFSGDTEVIELVDDPAENIKRIAEKGFSMEGTPTEFGGKWSRKDFLSWVDRQYAVDDARDFTLYEDSVPEDPQSLPSDHRATPSGTAEEMTLLVAMEQAFKSMGEDETSELRAARREVPDLFAAESPPLRFLRAVDFDPLKAARRLAGYWKRRCSLFGPKAFLPLHLSNKSALDPNAIRVIKNGEMLLLPDDKSGRPVLFFSSEPNQGKTGGVDARLQAFFYLVQVASEKPKSQTEGVVALRKWVPSLFSTSRFSEMIEIGSTSLPVQFYSHHLICLVPPSGQRSYLESITSRIYSFSSHLITGTTQVHVQGEKGEMNKALRDFDLCEECLPKTVGGRWDEERELHKWIEGRERREKKFAQRMFPAGIPEQKPDEPVCETVHNKEKALQALEEAINLMADEDKADYLEAKGKVPHLVLKESNPLWFVRCEKWNTWAAARRVAFYWKKRKEYFGKRAHLPMNQSGEGALSKEDVALLSTGYICLLPRDAKGRDVVCHDASRKPPGMLERRLRVLFYIGSMLAENRKNQTEGSRFVVILSKISLDGGFSKTMEIAKEVLPSLNYDVHIIHVPGEASKTTFMEKFVPPMLRILGSFLEERTKIHVNETKSTLVERLESHDFERSGLPSTVGGDWTYDQFYYWQEARIRMEWDLPLSSAQRKLVFGGDKYTCRGLSELNEGDRIERKRRLNLLHSRRKREKEKVEIEVLKSQVARLQDEKHEEEVERDRLTELLEQAHELVGRSVAQNRPGIDDFSQRGSLASDSSSSRPAQLAVSNLAVFNQNKIQLARNAEAYDVPSQLFSNSPQMKAMNPQSPDTARLQHMRLSGNLPRDIQGTGMQQQMQNMLPLTSLGYLRSQVPAPGYVTTPLATDNILYRPQMHQFHLQQFPNDPRARRVSHPDAQAYTMRLDPNQPIKRQRF